MHNTSISLTVVWPHCANVPTFNANLDEFIKYTFYLTCQDVCIEASNYLLTQQQRNQLLR